MDKTIPFDGRQHKHTLADQYIYALQMHLMFSLFKTKRHRLPAHNVLPPHGRAYCASSCSISCRSMEAWPAVRNLAGRFRGDT